MLLRALIVSYVAQAERENIRQRQAEGIAIAKAQGKHLGRFPSPIPKEFYPVYEEWKQGAYTLNTASKELGVTISQFRTMVRKHELKLNGNTGDLPSKSTKG